MTEIDEKSISISPKLLVWVGVVVVFLLALILLLNRYDQQRKYRQFTGLQSLIVNSKYPERFGKIAANFSPLDTIGINLIKEELGLLTRDYKEIDYSEMIVRGDGLFYRISSWQNYNKGVLMDTDRYLMKDEENCIRYLDENKEVDLKQLFKLSNESSQIQLMLKLNDNCYLLLKQYRY